MDQQAINKLIEQFDEVIDKLLPPRKKQVQGLIEKIGDRYFTAPASGSIHKHDAEPGGLAKHSLEVYENMKSICKAWFPNIPLDSIIILALFHDLGKIGIVGGEDHYLPTTQDWQIKKGIRYETNKDLKDGLTHAQRSVRILEQCGVKLTDSEYCAIILHDGLYVEENVQMKKHNSVRENSLLMSLHWSDYYTVFFEKGEK